MSKYRLPDSEILKYLNLEMGREYKSDLCSMHTVDLYPLLDAQIQSLLGSVDTGKLKEELEIIFRRPCEIKEASQFYCNEHTCEECHLSHILTLFKLSIAQAVEEAVKKERERIRGRICESGYLSRTEHGHGYLITDDLWAELFHEGQTLKAEEK